MLTLPAGAEHHICWGFGAVRIVHIHGRGAAGYSPVNSGYGAADNSPVNSGLDMPLAYTDEPFVTCTVSPIVDNFGILTYVQALIADNFEISAQIQALIADNFGIFNTIGKNKHNPGLELQISGITSCHSTNCATNSLRILYIKGDTTCNTGDVRQETCDRRGETGNLRQQTRDRRCETGDV